MTGDFLPERRRASVFSQLVTILLLLVAAGVAAWLLL
ncbi:hypothetical protein HNR71_001985 [Kribbella sandramycini]|uniref:Uncharacterized protein n=1 Tax=Kribbella sandramycini TaxID=60450 RepID=A0A841S2G2_9ACTN|nr:hypothetical protein [Kribbella sandramycini]